ncbi:DUF479 domain-containing protein [Shewanella yunxiaonensis]|uniref:DUF479 domain-containing protein n=1 Tax=Shewanella yunxiaonensis TaxID=2829809 RepID=A0ABX7YY66_9GAMM|nr:ACP phosphodiesterase [Shewanella yunxiaonensis]QUN07001.1 DUF479 domain-containing protein [Shewanella yunxiaonensis]
MNFLAHLHLADISGTSLAGNLAGDFAKGNIAAHPLHLQQGIWLHRQLDRITDDHELIKELRWQFPKSLQRVAPVLIDLAFDHMLARCWDEYHHTSLPLFCDQAYHALEQTPQLPERLQRLVPLMKQDNWLLSYAHRNGLEAALQGVSRRVSQPQLFQGAANALVSLDVEVEIAFRTFYPQLMAYSRILARKTPEQYL